MRLLPIIILLGISFTSLADETNKFYGHSPDYQREARLKDEIIDAILDGEAIELQANGHSFLAIDQEADGDTTKGGIIVLHGRGFHPDWPNVVQPLRTGLAANDWRTLSIQLPVLEKSAKYFDYIWMFDDAAPRIDAAIAYLKEQGVKKIILLAHSCGAHMAVHWLHEHGDKDLDAFIGIGMGATDYQQPMVESFPLAKLSIPVLDISAENDFGAVIRFAEKRKQGIQNPKSRQIIVPDTEHYFVDRGDVLLDVVNDWLSTL